MPYRKIPLLLILARINLTEDVHREYIDLENQNFAHIISGHIGLFLTLPVITFSKKSFSTQRDVYASIMKDWPVVHFNNPYRILNISLRCLGNIRKIAMTSIFPHSKFVKWDPEMLTPLLIMECLVILLKADPSPWKPRVTTTPITRVSSESEPCLLSTYWNYENSVISKRMNIKWTRIEYKQIWDVLFHAIVTTIFGNYIDTKKYWKLI